MGMTNSNSQGIRDIIGSRSCLKPQQGFNHEGNLLFGSPPIPGNRLFDL
jgi:hypothetical protein